MPRRAKPTDVSSTIGSSETHPASAPMSSIPAYHHHRDDHDNYTKSGRRVKAACTNCKKAKARCDQQRPCTRCVERNCTECVDAFPRRVGRRRNHFFNRIVTEMEVKATHPNDATKKIKRTRKGRAKRPRDKKKSRKQLKTPENAPKRLKSSLIKPLQLGLGLGADPFSLDVFKLPELKRQIPSPKIPRVQPESYGSLLSARQYSEMRHSSRPQRPMSPTMKVQNQLPQNSNLQSPTFQTIPMPSITSSMLKTLSPISSDSNSETGSESAPLVDDLDFLSMDMGMDMGMDFMSNAAPFTMDLPVPISSTGVDLLTRSNAEFQPIF
ncbi:hypothetical protein AAMO2058_001264800 [Amorphochlora amoebiformis]